jgi:hypothetical protein
MAATHLGTTTADEQEIEAVDDPDLQASLDEPAPHDAEEVRNDLRAMGEPQGRAETAAWRSKQTLGGADANSAESRP